jgi:hypothetical protein
MHVLSSLLVFTLISLDAGSSDTGVPLQAARQLLSAASREIELIEDSDKYQAQRELGTAYAHLGDLDAAKTVAAGTTDEASLAAAAFLAKNKIADAELSARLIPCNQPLLRADAFLQIADRLNRNGAHEKSIMLLRCAFWSASGQPIAVKFDNDISDQGYRQNVQRVFDELIELKDWDGAIDRLSYPDTDLLYSIVKGATESGDLDVAAKALIEHSVLEDNYTVARPSEWVQLASRVIRLLARDGKVDEAAKVCSAVASNFKLRETQYFDGRREEPYQPDRSLMPLVEVAAERIGTDAAAQVAKCYERPDKALMVEALARAAVIRRRGKDPSGYEAMMRVARADAAQIVERFEAEGQLLRSMVLAGDDAGAEHYAESIQRNDGAFSPKTDEIIASAKLERERPIIGQEVENNSGALDLDLLFSIRAIKSVNEAAHGFQLAEAIKESEIRLQAYICLMRMAPKAPEWTALRAQWVAASRAASNITDSTDRMWRLGESCEFQVAVFGLGDPDVKSAIDSLMGTVLPSLVVDDGEVYQIDPLLNGVLKASTVNGVLAAAARGEIARNKPDHARFLWSKLVVNQALPNPAAISQPEPKIRKALGQEIVAAYIDQEQFDKAAELAGSITSASDQIYDDLASAAVSHGRYDLAITLAEKGVIRDEARIIGTAVARATRERGAAEAIKLIANIDDPRVRVSILSCAACALVAATADSRVR